jgi:hypothetical protein
VEEGRVYKAEYEENEEYEEEDASASHEWSHENWVDEASKKVVGPKALKKRPSDKKAHRGQGSQNGRYRDPSDRYIIRV